MTNWEDFSPSDRQLLNDALARQERVKEAAGREIIDMFKTGFPFRTTPVTVKAINHQLSISIRRRVMRAHPYWRESKIRSGLAALVAAAHEANLDFVSAEVALSNYARRRERREDHLSHTVRNPAQKELIAFTGAVVGFVDTITEHLMPARQDLRGPLRGVLNKLTQSPMYEFVSRLRNNLLHGEVTVPSTVITANAAGVHGTIQFDIEELLAFGTWKQKATLFVHSFEDRIPIAQVMSSCVAQLGKCHDAVRDILRSSPTEAELDFFEIQDDYARWAAQQFMKIRLQPFVQKGTDPYPHLHRFFDSSEVREILRRPKNSKEQVELIIALKSPTTACDEELRASLYKIFNVEDAASCPVTDPGGAETH